MKTNLELEKPEIIKTFSYSLNEEYTVKAIGEGLKTGSSNSVLVDFVGKTKEDAESYCNEKGLDCSFKYVDENSKYFDEELDEDLIATQVPHGNTLMKNVDDVIFYINGKSTKNANKTSKKESDEENKSTDLEKLE